MNGSTSIALPAFSLTRRELVRFFRQPNRVIGALGQPLIFWLLIGSGLSGSFRPGGADASYMQYFYPGTILLVVLFTSIFSSMSTIEDRREGFLQGVLVSPIPRAALVLGKVLGGSAIALFEGLILLGLAYAVGIQLTPAQLAAAVGVLALVAFGLTALGFAVAWKMDSTQGFHAFMGLFLFPMWLLSGALFPAKNAHPVLVAVMAANPLTYGMAALRHAFYLGGPPPRGIELPGLGLSLAVTVLFGLFGFVASAALTRRREAGGHP